MKDKSKLHNKNTKFREFKNITNKSKLKLQNGKLYKKKKIKNQYLQSKVIKQLKYKIKPLKEL